MTLRDLLGERMLRAPETDQGAGPGPDVDDDFDPDNEDELPPDEDEGDLDADPDDQGDEPPGADDAGGEPARRPRSNETIRSLRAEKQRLANELEVERQVRATLQQRAPAAPPVDPAAEDAAFRERIAQLPFEEQIQAVADRERSRVGQALQGIEMRLAQSDDRSAFNSLVARNPVAARHADAVEAESAKYQRQGQFVSREVILKNLLGEIALKRGPGAARRAGARGAANVADARGRGSARGNDVPGRQRADPNSLEALEERLRGKFI